VSRQPVTLDTLRPRRCSKSNTSQSSESRPAFCGRRKGLESERGDESPHCSENSALLRKWGYKMSPSLALAGCFVIERQRWRRC